MTDLLSAALEYAAQGIPVFPCGNDKAPRTAHGHKDATTDGEKIRKWWTAMPGAWIGVPTGPSSGLAILDLDYKPEKGKDGLAAVAGWEALSPVISRTPSGGAHLYFRAEGAPRTTVDVLAHGVDTRGEGGYAIVPPSPGYAWINGNPDLKALPRWPDALQLPERGPSTPNPDAVAPSGEVEAALAAIPNDDVNWQEWNRTAMAAFAATEGEGFEVFCEWSAKSGKHDPLETERKWGRLQRSPPTSIGAGTLFHLASEAQPTWRADYEARLAAAVAGDADTFLAEMLGDTPDADVIQETEVEPTTIEPDISEPPPTITSELDVNPIDTAADGIDVVAAQKEQPPADTPKQTELATPKSEPTAPVTPPKSNNKLLVTNSGFMAGFKPPDYLAYGLIQKGFVYSLTAQTGTGKTAILLLLAALVAQGKPLADREVEKGKVLFMAGENPDDVRMRWLLQAEQMDIDHNLIDIVWRDGRMDLSRNRQLLNSEVLALGQFSLVIVDTAAAFFTGKEENSNVELGNFARELRLLTKLHGNPTVIVSTHPTKTPDMDNLLPRGGGAFLAEVDGNFACRRVSGNGNVVELMSHGKFRGPDFAPITFSINAGTTERLKDSKGRPIWTVTARVLSDDERAKVDDSGRKREDDLLIAMADNPGLSLAKLATTLGWLTKDGDPNKTLVNRTMNILHAKKMVKKSTGDRSELTKVGRDEAARAKDEAQRM